MNSSELKEALVSKGVNETLYSIGERASQSESYSIVEKDGRWQVLYKERGRFSEVKVDLTETEACDLVYEMFKQMFGWAD